MGIILPPWVGFAMVGKVWATKAPHLYYLEEVTLCSLAENGGKSPEK